VLVAAQSYEARRGKRNTKTGKAYSLPGLIG
jgi:hypothetical protein